MERTGTSTAHGHHGPGSGRVDGEEFRPASAGLSATVHRSSHAHPPPPVVGTCGPDGQSGSSLLVVCLPSTGSVIAGLRPAVLGRPDLFEPTPAPTGPGSKTPWMPSAAPWPPAALPPTGLVTGGAMTRDPDFQRPEPQCCHPAIPGWAGQQLCPSVVGLAASCPTVWPPLAIPSPAGSLHSARRKASPATPSDATQLPHRIVMR